MLEELIIARVHVNLTAIFEPGEVDEEFARLYRRAGGRNVVLFAGSLSEPVLARSAKPFQVDDVLRGAEIFRKNGIGYFLNLMLGGPGETPATIEETFATASRLRPTHTILDCGYRIQPDTELHRIAVAEGAIAPEDDCFKARFYHSPDTPAPLLKDRLRWYQAEHRLANWRAIGWMLGLWWRKYRP